MANHLSFSEFKSRVEREVSGAYFRIEQGKYIASGDRAMLDYDPETGDCSIFHLRTFDECMSRLTIAEDIDNFRQLEHQGPISRTD
ncbi:hypothetical protein [Rhodohalobacter sulfatireducens]|uniref:Uncharacterized protein n=1 Tax=Rhodohalobacter sulfatireducens TaxID=2911366 RepID=A0ABS9KE54_9BACT|nr:hypothetical protein [Rhodohalobacter sulfatireducens]MCG2589120.1 hypothetical protein [Rhodohalobacter sulfatireducens]